MNKFTVSRLFFVAGVTGLALVGLLFLLSSPSQAQVFHSTHALTPSAAPDLSVYKLLNGGAPIAGGQIEYRIAYTNQGDAAAQNVLITDTLPFSTSFVSWYGYASNPSMNLTQTVTPTIIGNQVVWNLGTVPAGQYGNIYTTVRITDTAQVGDVLTNVVQILSSDTEITYTNNAYTHTVAVAAPTQDMSIYKWVNGTPLPGSQIQYLISYSNQGNSPAHDIQITDTLPVSVAYVTHSAPGFTTVITGSTLVLTQAVVNAGSSGTVTLTVRITDTAQAGQVLTNVVRVSTSDVDINPANNTFTRTTTIAAPTQDMSIYKWVNGTPLPGGQIQYQINYSNLGNSPAHNIRITDTLPVSVTYLGHSASGFTTVITGSTLVLTQAVVNAGTSGTIYVAVRITNTAQPGQLLTNIVQVSTSDVDVNPANNIFTRVTIIAAPPVSTTISQSGGSFVVYTDTHGLTTTLDVPSDAVSGTVDLRYTALFTPVESISPELQLAGNAFDFDAYRNGAYLNGFTFSKTVTLTVKYSPEDLMGIEKNTVALYRWVSPAWQLVGVRPGEGQTLDADHNLLIVRLNGLSRFAKMGISNKIYLPLMFKGG